MSPQDNMMTIQGIQFSEGDSSNVTVKLKVSNHIENVMESCQKGLVIVFLGLIVFAVSTLSMYPSAQLAHGQQNCYGELAIFVHGIWPQLQTDNQADRVSLAILA